MIKVLQNWIEIGQNTTFISMKELPKHITAEKNWDFQHLFQIADPLDRGAKIIDLGCGGTCILRFLSKMGFTDLYGLDLNIPYIDRIRRLLLMWRAKTWKRPFRLYKRNLTHSGFKSQIFDLATCVSVIEHGVDFEKFLAEAGRILKPNGLLFITADYWEDKIDTSDDPGEFGLEWNVLCRNDVQNIIKIAAGFGLQPYEDANIPACDEKCISWHKRQYTFIAIVLKKTNTLKP